jgi:hypothetical protein
MHNHNINNLLLRALQSYHAERLAQKEIVRRRQGAKQKRRLVRVGDTLLSLGARLKVGYQSGAVAPIQRILHLGR